MKSVRSAFNLTTTNGFRKPSLIKDEENGGDHEHPVKLEVDVLKYNKEPDFSKLPTINSMYSAYKRMRSVILRTPI
jgi:hypothetical protein